MKTFEIYRHKKQGRFRAIKDGVSWPVVLLGIVPLGPAIWAFTKGLWKEGGIFAGLTLLYTAFQSLGSVGLQFLFGLAVLVAWIRMAKYGNDWVTAKLEMEGYKHKGDIDATTEHEALKRWASEKKG